MHKRLPTARILFPALLFIGVGVVAQAPKTQHEAHKLHGDPKAYIAALEDPARDAYQKPHEVMEALHVKEGEVIADIGAGSGYFTLRLSHHVGSTGHVYGVDISPDMIRHLNRLIEAFDRLTGVPVVLNTSFNRRGEPIVCTPQDAVRCFLAEEMDRLVLGPFLATRAEARSVDAATAAASAAASVAASAAASAAGRVPASASVRGPSHEGGGRR